MSISVSRKPKNLNQSQGQAKSVEPVDGFRMLTLLWLFQLTEEQKKWLDVLRLKGTTRQGQKDSGQVNRVRRQSSGHSSDAFYHDHLVAEVSFIQ